MLVHIHAAIAARRRRRLPPAGPPQPVFETGVYEAGVYASEQPPPPANAILDHNGEAIIDHNGQPITDS
jgi:hypothetical protein